MNFNLLKKILLSASVAAVLSSCGGGGGTSGGGSAVAVPPTPTPTPIPTPAPTPAGSVFSIGFGGPIIGTVTFDSNNSGIFDDIVGSGGQPLHDIRVDASPTGQFGPTAVDRFDTSQIILSANSAMLGGGIDTGSGYVYLNMRAPAGATTLSPATSLLRSIDDDLIAGNVGLGMTARELATFAAVPAMSSPDPDKAALGRRVTAFNMKLAAYAAIGTPADQAVIPDLPIFFGQDLAAVIEQLKAGRVDLNDEASIRKILERTPQTSNASSSDVGRAAAASLLARYAAAIDIYLTEPGHAADVEHGLRLIVLPAIIDLIKSSAPDTGDANAITINSLLAAFREFSEIPPPTIAPQGIIKTTIISSLIAVTDFRSIGRTATSDMLTLRVDCALGAGNNAPPMCNDSAISGSVGVDQRLLTLTAIRVPDKFATRFSATIAANGEIVLRRLNGATGLVWFEYDEREPGGIKATGRVYVRLGGTY